MKIIISLLLCILLATPAWASQKVLLFTTIDSIPGAQAISILQEAYGKLNIRIKGETRPIARALVDADIGASDGEALRTKAVEAHHPKLIRIDVPLHTASVMAFTSQRDLAIDGWASLCQYRVGIRTGIRFVELATREFPNVVKRVRPEHLFEQLIQGRLDVVVASPIEADKFMTKYPNSHIRAQGPPLAVFPLYHYLSRQHSDIAPAIERILGEMQNNGEIDRIRSKTTNAYLHQ